MQVGRKYELLCQAGPPDKADAAMCPCSKLRRNRTLGTVVGWKAVGISR